jgi:hypothetical protein
MVFRTASQYFIKWNFWRGGGSPPVRRSSTVCCIRGNCQKPMQMVCRISSAIVSVLGGISTVAGDPVSSKGFVPGSVLRPSSKDTGAVRSRIAQRKRPSLPQTSERLDCSIGRGMRSIRQSVQNGHSSEALLRTLQTCSGGPRDRSCLRDAWHPADWLGDLVALTVTRASTKTMDTSSVRRKIIPIIFAACITPLAAYLFAHARQRL